MLSTASNYPTESAGYDEVATVAQATGFNCVGVEAFQNQARLLFGVAPGVPRVAVPLSRVALSGDLADCVGVLNASTGVVTDLTTTYLNSQGADISTLQNSSIDTETITTGGVPIYCDWNTTGTDLPAIPLVNCPLRTLKNSDGTAGATSIGQLLLKEVESIGEGLAGGAVMYLLKTGGGWLLSAGNEALNALNGFMALSDEGLSLGADASGVGAALGGDLAAYEAGAEGLVMASTADEAASLFGSLGVLAEGGLAFSSAEGEIGQGLLTGIESSSGSFVQEAVPDFLSTLKGSAAWVAF